MLSTKVLSMKAAGDGIAVTFEGRRRAAEATFDYVLVSIGRRPNRAYPRPRQDRACR